MILRAISFSYAMRSGTVLLILHTSGCSCQEIFHKVHLKQLRFLPHEVLCFSSENGLCPPGIPVALAHFLSPKQKNHGINLRAATQMHTGSTVQWKEACRIRPSV